jgi:hypothetical protein
MNTNILFGSISMVVSLTASSIVGQPANIETQKLTVPNITQELNFERGEYKIVDATYDEKYMLSNKELISILREAGFSGYSLKYAWAIAVKESTKRPMAYNRSSDCYGLFQINMSGSLGKNRVAKYNLDSEKDLFDPLTNAMIAYQMSNGGKNWSAWTTNNSAKSIIKDFPN